MFWLVESVQRRVDVGILSGVHVVLSEALCCGNYVWICQGADAMTASTIGIWSGGVGTLLISGK